MDGKDLNEQEASEKRVITEGEQMKTFYNKLTKANELITTAILKWKLTETNRASFKFNSGSLGFKQFFSKLTGAAERMKFF